MKPPLAGKKRAVSLRCAITIHRSRREDFDLLVENVVRIGDEILAGLLRP